MSQFTSFAPPWRGPYRAPTAPASAVYTSTPLETTVTVGKKIQTARFWFSCQEAHTLRLDAGQQKSSNSFHVLHEE